LAPFPFFEEDAEVSNGSSRGGFGFGLRGTLDGVEKKIAIPETTALKARLVFGTCQRLFA